MEGAPSIQPVPRPRRPYDPVRGRRSAGSALPIQRQFNKPKVGHPTAVICVRVAGARPAGTFGAARRRRSAPTPLVQTSFTKGGGWSLRRALARLHSDETGGKSSTYSRFRHEAHDHDSRSRSRAALGPFWWSQDVENLVDAGDGSIRAVDVEPGQFPGAACSSAVRDRRNVIFLCPTPDHPASSSPPCLPRRPRPRDR